MDKKDILKELLVYLVFAAILYFFYKRWWAFILLPPACIIYHRFNKKAVNKKQQELLGLQFKDALISITSALRAGYSIENSINESLSEMNTLYGNRSPIFRELSKVKNELRLGTNIENALAHFAERNSVEDIKTFSSVFSIAKRSGGDLVEILKKTSDDISAKIDTGNEIAVSISAKKLEQKIMSFMPLGILVYISLASPSILEPLYGNALGILVMTVALVLYAFAYYLSLRIMNIEV